MISMSPTVRLQAKTSGKGLFSTLASGAGLVCRFQGPGKVWMQTRSLGALARLLAPFLGNQKQSLRQGPRRGIRVPRHLGGAGSKPSREARPGTE